MKCAYNAAILDAFLDEGIHFDYCIGVSAASGNIVSYLAHQRGRNIRFFTDYTHFPQYFGLQALKDSGDLFNLRFIYNDLTKHDGIDPLDYDAFIQSKSEYEAVVTNALSGKAEYLNKSWFKPDDASVIMASSAIPVACHPVKINGIPYYDGGLADAIPVQRALDQGCDKLVVILSKNRDYVRKPQSMKALYETMLRKYPKVVEAIKNRHITYNRNLEEVFALEKQGKAFVLAPSEPLKVSTFTMNEQQEWDLYHLGFKDFDQSKVSLKTFMNQ